jgi:hypothetical protein
MKAKYNIKMEYILHRHYIFTESQNKLLKNHASFKRNPKHLIPQKTIPATFVKEGTPSIYASVNN